MNTRGLVVDVAGEREVREAALAELRARLADGLAHKGLQKTQIAGLTALSRTTVQEAFRHDGQVPSQATVVRLANRLGLPVNELLELRRAAAAPSRPTPSVEDGPGKPIGRWDPHDLEVHPAGPASAAVASSARSQRELPGYVRRAHDHVLAEAVAEAAAGRSRMLVLVGSSSTGKTRACWEAVQPLAGQGWRLWHPFDPTRAEAALAELTRVASRTVVWLNDAQHYLGHPQHGERIAAALHTLLTDADRRPVLVVGTLWPEYAGTYGLVPPVGEPDPHSRVRELLTARTVPVPDAFDQEALRAASAFAQGGDTLIADALTRVRPHGRLTQDLAGAPELLCRFEQGSPPVKALLEAAMDARRLGIGLHLPQSFLIDAVTDYLTDHDYDQLAEDWAEAAFADLARPVHGKQAPLRRTTARGVRRPVVPASSPALTVGTVFRLADYLEQHGRDTRRRLCPPVSFWDAAHTHVTDGEDLNNLAEAAYRRRRLHWGDQLRRRAADTGHPEAMALLAGMLEEVGDREDAERLYLSAADAGHSEALAELARMREEAGDRNGAEALARRAADAGDPDAMAVLARMREKAGDRDDAEALARRAAEAGDFFALSDLARMREKAGDRNDAEALARRAIDIANPRALVMLARVQEEAGDLDGAETLYTRAADAGLSEALLALARMREDAGDRVDSEARAQQAADAGRPDALLLLARMRERAGNPQGTHILYTRAAYAGSGAALVALAQIQERAGDRQGGETLYALAADAGRPEALLALARMREEAGDREGSEACAQQAVDAGDTKVVALVARMREEAGDREGVEALARMAADAARPEALLALARILEKAGDREDAEALYDRAADFNDPFVLPELARIREEAGDREGAEALAWRAIDAGNGIGLLEVARMREKAGDREDSEALYRQLADSGFGIHITTSRWPHGLDPDGMPTVAVPCNSDFR